MVGRVGMVVGVLVLVVSLVATAPPAGAEPGPATTLECGQVITADVVLAHDLTCTEGEIFWVAAGVTVDLGGHTVSGGDPTFDCLFDAYASPPWDSGQCHIRLADDAVLTNGRLVDVSVGMIEHEGAELSRLVLERTDVPLNAGNRLHHSLVLDSEILLYDYRSGDGPTVDHNWLRGTHLSLTNVQVSPHDVRIDSNIIERSPSHGVDIATCCYSPGEITGSITGNWIIGSTRDGIHAPQTGESMDFGELTIAGNVLAANGGDGIALVGRLTIPGDCRLDRQPPCSPQERFLWAGPVVVRDNVAIANGGHGIFVDLILPTLPEVGTVFPPDGYGVIDGGGNRALFNRERPACVGLRCRWW